MIEAVENLAGIVLAGGRSRRMGTDKAALEFEGVSMLTRITETAAKRCQPILVAAPTSSAAYAELGADASLQWVTSEADGSGPLGGLVAALAVAADAGADAAFVCATDMPLIAPELIDELLAGLSPSIDAVIAHAEHRDHPMAGIYRTGVLPVLSSLVEAGELRMLAAVDAITTRRVGISDPTWLTNVDAPEDLHRLRVRAGSVRHTRIA